MWYDDHPKRTLAEKIADARAAYAGRFGRPATLALVSPDDLSGQTLNGVRPAPNVRRNTVWAGLEEAR